VKSIAKLAKAIMASAASAAAAKYLASSSVSESNQRGAAIARVSAAAAGDTRWRQQRIIGGWR